MRKLVYSWIILMLSLTAWSQERKVQGKVLDEQTKEPIVGASVVVLESKTATETGPDGSFSILVPDHTATLSITYVGMLSQEIKIGKEAAVSVFLHASPGSLNEVVVTGYTTERKKDLTGAVSIVNVGDIKDIPSGNPMQSLQGRVPGLYVESDGSPNPRSRRILIRGLNTLGNTDPLYVIDGVPTKRPTVFQNLNPDAIESIQILKDASAASIYGSRASNGVVIVTTKGGKAKQKLQIEVNSNLTIEKYTSSLKVLNTEQRGEALWRASINDKTNPNIHSALYTYDWHIDPQGVALLDKVHVVDWIGGQALGVHSANTNWQDVVFHNGITTSTDLTLSSASDKNSLVFNGGYYNNEGMVRYTDFKRFNAMLNSWTKFIGGKLKVGENLQLSKQAETPVPNDLGGASVISLAKFLQPIIPVYTTTGEYAGPPIGAGFSDRNNPLHMLDINQDDKNHLFNLFGNVYAELTALKNLTIRSSFGIDYVDIYNVNIERAFKEGFLSRTVNSLSQDQQHKLNTTFYNTANYNVSFGKSKINALLGTEIVKEQLLSMGIYKEGFALQNADYFTVNAGTGRTTSSGTETGSSLLSFFGKVGYAWNDKYLLSATLRRDGSSRFGVNNRFGMFPAASAGWKISDESFFHNVKFVSTLKLRGGYGVVGNQDIGDNARFGLYQTNYGGQSGGRNTGTAYDINGQGSGTLPSGYVSLQAENDDLKWESTHEVNLGMDIGLFDEKLTGSVDIFKRVTDDILIQPPYPAILGEGKAQWVNGATKENRGFEVALGYQNNFGRFTYNINGNISSFKDRITYLPKSVLTAYPGNVEKTILGHSQTALFGYVTDGLFQNQAEVDKHATQPGKGIGRLRYVDLNHDGKIDPLDQDWLGNQLPDFIYGLNLSFGYKNFSLTAFLQGVQGVYVFNGIKSSIDFVGANSGMNYGIRVLDAWSPQNTTSTIPALSLVNANNETRTSNYFIEDGSYLKLRNLQLGYSFPKIGTVPISALRIYAMCQNLFTIKKNSGTDQYTGPDPENPSNLYPRATSYTLGLNLTF